MFNFLVFREFQSMKKAIEHVQNEQSTLWDQICLINSIDFHQQNSTQKSTSPIISPSLSTNYTTDIGAIMMPTSTLLNKHHMGTNYYKL